MFRVWSDSFFSIRLDYGRKLVVLARTERGFASSTDLVQAYARLAHELRSYSVATLGVLIDARLAPPVSPTLEIDFIRLNSSLFSPFRCCAVLLQPTGIAQGKRICPPGARVLVTSSLAEASVHLGLENVLAVA